MFSYVLQKAKVFLLFWFWDRYKSMLLYMHLHSSPFSLSEILALV